MTIKRRTFEAAKYPKGSPERAKLNECSLTSEYMTSYRYTIETKNFMSDGTLNPVQPIVYRDFRTKAEAEAAS
jgi:hypothetical protein